ncbi:MAG: alpha/beta fold hydrolase [Candidatus Solibacter sp.]|nr:alpha/beta fold hydrolase [Candidatus Solibacter sp.]
MNRILYLHGFASSPASGKARFFAERLRSAGARIDIPDLAAGDFEHLTISGQLRIIEQAAAGDPVALMGSSMGGYLAALYAARHPEVPRMVLLAPAFGFARRWAEHMGADAVAAWRATGSVEVFHYGENRKCRLSYALLDDGSAYEDYPDFHQPALIFHGALDDIVPARYSVEFAAAHPNAHLEILDSGHQLLNVLEYLAPKVREFLAGPETTSA